MKYLVDIDVNMAGVLWFMSMKMSIPCETVNVEGIPKYNKSGKWICIGLYKSLSQNGKYFLKNLPLALNKMSCVYVNITLVGDSQTYCKSKNIEVFMNTFDLECLTENLLAFNLPTQYFFI